MSISKIIDIEPLKLYSNRRYYVICIAKPVKPEPALKFYPRVMFSARK